MGSNSAGVALATGNDCAKHSACRRHSALPRQTCGGCAAAGHYSSRHRGTCFSLGSAGKQHRFHDVLNLVHSTPWCRRHGPSHQSAPATPAAGRASRPSHRMQRMWTLALAQQQAATAVAAAAGPAAPLQAAGPRMAHHRAAAAQMTAWALGSEQQAASCRYWDQSAVSCPGAYYRRQPLLQGLGSDGGGCKAPAKRCMSPASVSAASLCEGCRLWCLAESLLPHRCASCLANTRAPVGHLHSGDSRRRSDI